MSASKQVDGKRKIMDLKSQRLKEKHQEMYRAANKAGEASSESLKMEEDEKSGNLGRKSSHTQ